ncbi:hypothetical protein GCM10009668_39920 [Nocardioides dubius]|uniref:Putative pterin-4-alpha-carbinolamine dehydratase n=2 Tax=Nocardioides dubius TaxID=317019 RepID=A0ABN1U2C7_9ACTN
MRKLGGNKRKFGGNKRKFGGNKRKFGGNKRRFGGNKRRFGGNKRRFGVVGVRGQWHGGLMSPIPASDKEIRRSPEIEAAGLHDWRLLQRTLGARFTLPDYDTGLALVGAIGAAAQDADHHPDLDLRWGLLGVRLSSHDVNGVTDRDLRLAARISELAAELGASADPTQVQMVELGLDSADFDAVRPFWKALLGMKESRALPDELDDPRGDLPTLWFQETDAHPTPRQRFHLDVYVPRDLAEQRVADALAAGGTLVSDAEAPGFWVLADAEGNRACVCSCT